MAVGVSQCGSAVNQHMNNDSSATLLLPADVSSLYLLQTHCLLAEDPSESNNNKKASMEKEMGDVFFGVDDVNCVKDLVCKEDVIDCMRREAAIKSLRKRRNKRRPFITDCFQFLKLVWCL